MIARKTIPTTNLLLCLVFVSSLSCFANLDYHILISLFIALHTTMTSWRSRSKATWSMPRCYVLVYV